MATFTVVHDWGDTTVIASSANFWPQPSGAPVLGQIIAGVLCNMSGTPGVALVAGGSPALYEARFEGVTISGKDGSIASFAFSPGAPSSTVDLGSIYGAIAVTRLFGAPPVTHVSTGIVDNHDGTATG